MTINLLNKITHSDFLNKHINRTIQDDTFAAKTLVTINVAKDIFAYGTRFKTTMSNKEIPEEKRPFIASMDLMSGAVTAILQLGVGYSLANPKIQNTLWDKLFKNCKFQDMAKAKKGFSQILALIGSTILAERILVPLIATPCAELFEKKFFNNEAGSLKNSIDKFNFVSLEDFKKSAAEQSLTKNIV